MKENMIESPLISIIIPTFNRNEFLIRSVQSVLDQTYQNFEIIIVDDHSTDQTFKVGKELEKKDKRIKFLSNPINIGACAARNKGIMMASGVFIAFLDDDDIWFPEKLEKQLQEIQRAPKNIGMVSVGCIKIGKDITQTIIPKKKIYKTIDIIEENPICDPLIKKDVLKKVGFFDINLESCQDWDLWIRISRFYDILVIQEPLMYLCIHGNQISLNYRKIIQGQKAILDRFSDIFLENPQKSVKILNTISFAYFKLNQKSKYKLYLKKSVKIKKMQKETFFLFLLPFFNIFFPLLQKRSLRIIIKKISKRDIAFYLN